MHDMGMGLGRQVISWLPAFMCAHDGRLMPVHAGAGAAGGWRGGMAGGLTCMSPPPSLTLLLTAFSRAVLHLLHRALWLVIGRDDRIALIVGEPWRKQCT